MSPLLERARGWMSDVPRKLRDPVTQADLLLVFKAALAAVVSWLLAVRVFGFPQPFLAPWAALLTVHATVYRSVSRGVQQVAATMLGVLLSFALGQLLGINGVTLGLALLLALLVARVPGLREEGITAATTALFVLTTGYQQQEDLLLERVLATGLGIALGVVVNLLVVPPLNDRSAAQHVDVIDQRLGHLLRDMARAIDRGESAEAMTDWVEATRRLDQDLDHAWEIVGSARESTWLNPRRRRATLGKGELSYEGVLYRLEDGVSEARTMARTIRESTVNEHEWDPRFRERWLDLLRRTGERVADPDAEVSELRDDLDALARELSIGELPHLRWPIYGALWISLANIVAVVDDVASSEYVREADGAAENRA